MIESLRENYQRLKAHCIARQKAPVQLIWLPVVLALLTLAVQLVDATPQLSGEAVIDAQSAEYIEQSAFKIRSTAIHNCLRNTFLVGFFSCLPLFAFYLLRGGLSALPLGLLSVLAGVLCAVFTSGEIANHWEGARSNLSGAQPAFGSYLFKLILVGVLPFLPVLALLLYKKAGTLARYLTRSLFVPFMLCFLGIIAIWMIFDLSDNGPDFIEARTPLTEVFRFYMVVLPQMVVQILPVTLLLAALYSLSKLSRNNEIMSMLTAGISVRRILTPFFIFGLFATFLSLVMNYHWAPRAEGHQEAILETIRHGEKATPVMATRQLYRNRADHRTWYVGNMPYDLENEKLKHIWVVQENEKGEKVKEWIAKQARWFKGSEDKPPVWRFYFGKEVSFGKLAGKDGVEQETVLGEKVFYDKPHEFVDMVGWEETPWQLVSSGTQAEYLGVQGLVSYLKTNKESSADQLAPFKTFWHHRFANPWSCFVSILVAAPLGIVLSRRGMLEGVAASIFIFVGMFFIESLFLAICQGNRMSALLGAWMSNLIFGGVGLYLLYYRSRNKEIPLPSLGNVKAMFADIWERYYLRPRASKV